MNQPQQAAAPLDLPLTARTLRRLFLTLFLRGRSARGLHRSSAPKSIASKLALTLGLYTLVGFAALALWSTSVFALSASLHAMTFLFLGMFVAASAGEVLFNKEEADILLHRPVAPRSLLWAKIRVLVEVSLWLSGALNLVSFFVGFFMPGGGWLFPIAHAISITLEALFCTGCVVVVYQLCLRWFGRERLDGLMTTAQIVVALSITLGGQVVPQVVRRMHGTLDVEMKSWWVSLLPPVWFAAFDDALAGTGSPTSWALSGLGLVVTLALLGVAFGKLAADYERGLQTLNEAQAPVRARVGRRWFDVLVNAPPLRWWLRDSVARAAFLLSAAYLVRDRDVKLRVYPGTASILVMPLVFLLGQGTAGGGGGFGLAMAGSFLGLVPLLGLSTLRFSQQWQASDIFRAAPMLGPAQLCHGARRAVLLVLTLPVLVAFGVLAALVHAPPENLQLVIPGLLALPVFALVPCLGGAAVPLSLPTEEAKAANRGTTIIGVMLVAFVLSGLGLWARSGGWFWWLVSVQAVAVVALYIVLRRRVGAARWSSLE
jgi:ABC-2 type transport system permease protein